MFPILLDLHIIKIYTYGVFLVLAFFWSLFWYWRNLKRTSFKEEEMFDGVFICMLGGLFFARLTYFLLNFQDFGPNIMKFILINGYPGLSLIGALIGAFFTLTLFTRVQRLPYMEVVAYAVPSLFLAIGIAKIGSFFGGTVVGTETTFPLSVQYVGHAGQRHIVAIYEAILMFIGFFVSQKMVLTYRRDKIDVGSLFSFFVFWVALMYMSLDFLKDDTLYLANLRFNVIFPGIFLGIVTVWELIKYRKEIFGSVNKLARSSRKHGKKATPDTDTA